MTKVQAIQIYQPTLQAIAYKLLGSIADAEDAVHDAFVKWLTIDTSKIDNVKAYLIKMVTNACLNDLRLQKENVGIGELHDVVDNEKEHSLFQFDLDAQLTEALEFLQKRLEPVEKTVFVLREVFNVDYEDLQYIVDRKAENCRKIMSRAKTKLKSTELPRIQVSIPDFHLLESFKSACQIGNLNQLIQEFTTDLFKKK